MHNGNIKTDKNVRMISFDLARSSIHQNVEILAKVSILKNISWQINHCISCIESNFNQSRAPEKISERGREEGSVGYFKSDSCKEKVLIS